MPDESCRKCGGLLLDYAVCAKCRAPIRFICRICGTKTLEKIHEPICFRIHDNDVILNFPNLGCEQIFLEDTKTVKIIKL